jgi:opacity protein-like surface antigen
MIRNPRSSARIAFTRTSTDLEYRDDTGTGSSALDIDDVAGLSSNILSVEVMRHVLPTRIRLSPYGGLGLAFAWWNLDERGVNPLIIAGDDDETLFRFGASAIAGLEYRFSPRWAVRAEATTFSIRNPFTGRTSFIPVTGLIVDEPTHVRQTNFRLAAAYTFAPREAASRARRPGRRR